MESQPKLGPFVLEDRLGEGGMGLVYRGHHETTDVPVALKVIRQALGPQARERFHREVQAHAKLLHPGVVYLFEYGNVPEEATAADEALIAGRPFVAMELADRGTIRDHMPVSGWPAVRTILTQILDALAYAHARDVVHRDLKPENLLLFATDDDSTRVKLTDFGIAHALGEESDHETPGLSEAAGTPLYMAPEQIRGRWRDFGPWTDLYGLGCVTYELICGHPPFSAEGALPTLLKHQKQDRPPLEPRFPVPDGLEEWLHRAMAIAPGDRFRRAAEAQRALGGLGDVIRDAEPGPSPDDIAEAPTLSDDRTDEQSSSSATRPARLASTKIDVEAPTVPFDGGDNRTAAWSRTRPAFEKTNATGPSPDGAPTFDDPAEESDADSTIPRSWRTRRTDELPPQLVGTGLGLFGLRETPFVDRDSEREHLWRALRSVAREGSPRVVLIIGVSGTGKSRLVSWMATRAHELDAATPMRAVHTPGGRAPAEGIAGMIRRLVRGQKLDRSELYDHLVDQLPPLDDEPIDRQIDARAVCELVFPTPRDDESVDGPRYQFSSADQKYHLLARLLRRYGQRRPPLVWLDDAQWANLALPFAHYLLDNPLEQPPALVAATLRPEALADSPSLAERVEALASHPRCTRIDLEALAGGDHREFVARLLPLADDLLERLAERTEGNPLFATQLLGHFVDRDRLEATPDGFRLPDGASLELPADIHQLWMRRLERLVDRFDGHSATATWEALERTAALGREIVDEEWRAVCNDLDVETPDRLRDELVDRGLADDTGGGWAFAHRLLVDSLERRARAGDRWRKHNRRCVRILERVYPDQPTRTASRRAEHHIEAGDLADALEPMLREAERLRRSGDASAALDALRRRETLLDELDLEDHDPRRIENVINVAGCQDTLGTQPEEVFERLQRAKTEATARHRYDLAADACFELSRHVQTAGDYERALAYCQEGRTLARRTDDDSRLTKTLYQRGWLAYRRGHLDRAEECLSRARRQTADTASRYLEGVTLRLLAYIALARGDFRRASQRFDELLALSKEVSFPSWEAVAVNGLGELARYAGDPEDARAYYRRARQLVYELNRLGELANSTLNLAVVELLAGRFDIAAEHLNDAERQLEKLGRRAEQLQVIRLVRLTHAAGTESWSAFDRVWARYAGGWPEETRLERDHPWLLEMAGDYAAEAGKNQRAEQAWKLARELWTSLDDEQAVDRVADKLPRDDG